MMASPLSLIARVACTIVLAASSGLASSAPPVAPVRDVVENLHGVTVHDPYRYFENVSDPQVRSWLNAQGMYARQTLDGIEGRAEWEKRIAEIAAATGDSVRGIVRMPGDRLYYLKRARGEKQYKLVMRRGGREQVMVDPQVESARTGVGHAIDYFRPSWDGRYMAYGMSQGGSEDASLYVIDIGTGKRVQGPIPRVREPAVSWLPDSRSFTFNQLRALSPEEPETETYLDTKVMLLRVGAADSEARAIFGPAVNRQLGLERLDVGKLLFTPGSDWVVARTTDTTQSEGSLFVAKVADLQRGEVPWKRISRFDDKIVDIELSGDSLYFRTKNQAPRFKVMRLDLREPQLTHAVEVALPPAGGVLEGFSVGRDAIMAEVREGSSIGLRLYTRGDVSGHAVKLPFKGAAGVGDDPAHVYADWVYVLGSWTRPAQTYVLRGGASTELALGAGVKLPKSLDIEAVEASVPSHDGVRVPLTILHRKGMRPDGRNPTLLRGYGSYGFSETAHFSPGNLAWLQNGGVLAFANVRGSGVYGDEWRLAGFKATKPNTWKDGVAAARYLIEKGYASAKTLGIMGTSAGGIFVGRAVTTAPELFAAAIFNVGVMDGVRQEESANGVTNISEFGTYRNPSEFPALLEMSTYHHIVDGTAYPGVLVVQGLNDPRVDVWHSAKVAARLQAASSSGKPVLLRLDAQAGHGMGSTATQRYAMEADIFSFLLWQMGMAGRK